MGEHASTIRLLTISKPGASLNHSAPVLAAWDYLLTRLYGKSGGHC